MIALCIVYTSTALLLSPLVSCEYSSFGYCVLIFLQESDLDIVSKVLVLLCSLEKEIQCLCVSALLNLTTNKPDKYV